MIHLSKFCVDRFETDANSYMRWQGRSALCRSGQDMSESNVLQVLGLIYDAALDHQRWPDALEAISAFLNVDGASLALEYSHSLQSLNTGVGADALRGYGPHWHAVNPLWPKLRAAAAGTVLVDRAAVDRQVYLRGAFYNDFVRPNGMYAAMSIKVLENNAVCAAIALHRVHGPGAREFSEHDAAQATLLAPHLARALQTSDRLAGLRQEAAMINDALEWLPQPTYLVNAQAGVVFANESGRVLLRASDGLRSGPDGLHGHTAAATDDLRRCIALAAGAGGPLKLPHPATIRLERPSGKRALSALVGTFRCHEGERFLRRLEAVAIIFVTDPEASAEPPLHDLRRRYGLTAAEAALALVVARGEGLKAVAAERRISVATAKTHLHQIFSKTGTRRQAELVRLLLSHRRT